MNFFLDGLNKFGGFLKWQWAKDKTIGNLYRNIVFNRDTPVYIDTEDLNIPYEDCSYLRIAIDKKSEMFSNGLWKCVDANDETVEITDDEGLKLLMRPNVMQTAEEFLKQYIYYKDVFANNFIRKLSGSSLTLPKALWHLPSDYMCLVRTGKYFNQTDIDGIIKYYKLDLNGEITKFDTSEIIYKGENYSFTEGKGLSKITSLQLPISNIVAALKTRNIIATEKGAIGILSNDTKDQSGGIPLGKEERERIEKQLKSDRGLYSDKSKIIVTNSGLKWNAMSFPTKDLALFEEIEEDFSAILGAYGLDRDIFPSVKGATFENKRMGLINTYQNTIQPEADALAGIMTHELKADERGRKYVLDYSWLPVMQEDKQKEETIDKTRAEKLSIMLDKGIIGREAFAEMMGVELTGKEIQPSNATNP